MDYSKKILRESIAIVIISSLIGLCSGTVLSINKSILYSIPILLLILPALNSLIGDISTVLVSRLTTHLYIGNIEPKVQKSDRLKEDFYGLLLTILLSLVVIIFVGFFIGFTTGIKTINPFLLIIIILATIIFLFVILFVLLLISSIHLFKRGKDPNNFLIPFVTSLADFLTPFLLILFIMIFI
ncbi:MAG: magnesium transporter [Promethearchaeota archaeon]